MTWLIIALLVLVAVVVWVFLDARGRDWSGTRYDRRTPAGWAFIVAVLWVIYLPVYVVARGKSIPRRS